MKHPVQTFKNGTKTTKVVIEPYDKVVDKLIRDLGEAKERLEFLRNSLTTDLGEGNKLYIVGTGHSQPHPEDVYNEETGSIVAFKKAKLNANIKKGKLLLTVNKLIRSLLDDLYAESSKLTHIILKDLEDLKKF